ncbi:hypothetical protein BC834DRAFT_847989 [Gloeopeniophorella convolvens]|nr:hypothetical protein BC834DRAFT_847989 [Gloeopeniophorella convolvens]
MAEDHSENFDLSDVSVGGSDGDSSDEEMTVRRPTKRAQAPGAAGRDQSLGEETITRRPFTRRTQALAGATGHVQGLDRTAIMEAQLENQRLREVIRDLRMTQIPDKPGKRRAKLSSRTVSGSGDTDGLHLQTDSNSLRSASSGARVTTSASPSPSSAASSATGVTAGQPEDKHITSCASHFAVTGELFLEKHILNIPFPDDVDPMQPIPPEEKYRRQREKAIAAELILSLPAHYRAALEDPDHSATFKNTFFSRHQQERSNLVCDARAFAPSALIMFFVDKIDDPKNQDKKILPPDVNGPGSAFFDTSVAAGSQRAQHPKLRELFHNPEKPTEHYPVWPAMLFENRNTSGPGVFLGEELIALCKFLIFKKSASTLASADSGGRKSGRQAKGKQWNLKKTTPAMIATSAVFVQFICSEDTVFHSTTQTGPSGVSWPTRWNIYKQTILSLPDDFRQLLLSRWDQELFAATSAPGEGSGGIPSKAQEVSDFHRFVHRMRTTDARPAELVQQQLDDPVSPSPILGTPFDIPAGSVSHGDTNMPASSSLLASYSTPTPVSGSTPTSGPLPASLSPLPPPTPAPVKTCHASKTSEVMAQAGSADMPDAQVETLTVKLKRTKGKGKLKVLGPAVADTVESVDLSQVELLEESVQKPNSRRLTTRSSRSATQKKTG